MIIFTMIIKPSYIYYIKKSAAFYHNGFKLL